jgi:hypothetical protein
VGPSVPQAVWATSAASRSSWVLSRQIQPSTFRPWQRHFAAPPAPSTAST